MTISTGTYAARPAGSEGDVYFPTDGIAAYYKNATIWQPFGPCFPWVTPDDSDFSWVNQGAATVDDSWGPICLTAPAVAGYQWRIRKKTAPATPYTVTAAFFGLSVDDAAPNAGLCWRQSSDGKLIVFTDDYDSGLFLLQKWTNATTYSANYTFLKHGLTPSLVWFRLEDDGVNRKCHWSPDGQYWVQFYSVARTDFLTADEIGFCANSVSATHRAMITLAHWQEA